MSDLVSVLVRDENGNTDRFKYYIPSGNTLADIEQRVDSDLTALDLVTGGVIEEAQITIQLSLPGGLKSTAIAGSKRAIGANMLFDAGVRNSHTIKVPALRNTYINQKQVNNSGDFVSLHTHLLTAVNTISLEDGNGNTLLTFLSTNQANSTK